MVLWPYKMGRVAGTPPPSPSLGNSGRHSGQEAIFEGFPMVLGSWWEIFENGDRGSTQNFDARLVSIVVWLGEPFFEKNIVKQLVMDSEVHIWIFCKRYGP